MEGDIVMLHWECQGNIAVHNLEVHIRFIHTCLYVDEHFKWQ